jgi:hypothetical protein
MKQVSRVKRYIHSKTTPRIFPTWPRRVLDPREVVRIWKTRKKLPMANHAKIMLIVVYVNSIKNMIFRKKLWSLRKSW